VILDLVYMIARGFPSLKVSLKRAHLKETPQEFVKKILLTSFYISLSLTILFFFIVDKQKISLLYLLAVFPLAYVVVFFFMMKSPTVGARKRMRNINKEVLFAGRYLLVKLESGTPLFNTLIDASKSYGVSAKYFKEIVDEINTGKPIEQALDEAREYNASDKFKLILSELVTSLNTGVDVSIPLRAVIDQITKEQLIEIKEYGKKLNAYIMLYMVLAIVVPSLGMTVFSIIAAFLSLELSMTFIIIAVMILSFVQFMFLSLFKSIRPMVNL